MADPRVEQRIVAVGYEIDFQPIADLLEQHRPGHQGDSEVRKSLSRRLLFRELSWC